MLKKFSYFIYKIIFILDRIIFFIFKKNFLIWLKDFIHEDSYKSLNILNKKVNFFVPNSLVNWRINTFYKKEPETLEWIDSFVKNDKIVFWDIGSNVGLYSIYNALKNANSITIAFEPSTSNLRVLSRNVSINNLQDKILIMPIALTDKENKILTMHEGRFFEGGALNSFGENYNYEGKSFETEMKYKILGTSINNLIENNILEIPDYIKIDVDGIEHIILKGGDKFLSNNKIKSLLIEVNENFEQQYEAVLSIMKKNGFKILKKKNNESLFDFDSNNTFSKVFNYIFIRQR